MRLHDLLDGADVLELRGEPHVTIDAVVHDHRAARPGALFCCIRGAVADGHDHAAEAVARGASALLVERFCAVDVPQARVASVRFAIGPLAAAVVGDPSRALRVLGVTGTNGKTTTTYLLEAIAVAAGERAGVIGTVATRIDGRELPPGRTTPEAPELQRLLAAMRDEGVTTVAMEVSSHALDQHRVDGTWFHAACFTNLSHDHLDYHGDLDHYFAAKARLFDPVRAAVGIVNLDDPVGGRLAELARGRDLPVVTYGRSARVRAVDVDLGAAATSLRLVDTEGATDVAVRSPLVGSFNVENLLAAATTALAAGFSSEAVATGLERSRVVPGRLERVERGQPFAVLVDYAHTPDALERVLDAVRPIAAPGGRVVVVFGCGGDRDRAKRPKMGGVVERRADLVVVTSDNPRSEDPAAIADEVLGGMRDPASALVELDRRAAIRVALGAARPGDVVVVAGKGHETGQTAGSVTRPFDDRVVVGEELETLQCA